MHNLHLPEVEVQEIDRLSSDGHGIVDVREDHEFAAGHIPGSLHLPLSRFPDSVDQLDHSKNYLVICRSGGRSAKATEHLHAIGIHAHNVAGGLMNFVASGGRLTTRSGSNGELV